jgi:hypothetical protein
MFQLPSLSGCRQTVASQKRCSTTVSLDDRVTPRGPRSCAAAASSDAKPTPEAPDGQRPRQTKKTRSRGFQTFRTVATFVVPRFHDVLKADVRGRLRRVLCYAMFMLAFSLGFVAPAQNQDIFWQGGGTDQLLETSLQESLYTRKNFADIATIPDAHAWLQGPFFRTMYCGDTRPKVNEHPLCQRRFDMVTKRFLVETVREALNQSIVSVDGNQTDSGHDPSLGVLFGVNQVIGGIMVGQVRVPAHSRTSGCALSPGPWVYSRSVPPTVCFGDRGELHEEADELKEAFGVNLTQLGGNREQFLWDGKGWGTSSPDLVLTRTLSPLDPSTIRLTSARRFPWPAFQVILPHPSGGPTEAMSLLRVLERGEYFDEHTRALFVQMNMFNAVNGRFNVLTIAFESSKGGVIRPSITFMTMPLYWQQEFGDLLPLVSEAVAACFIVFFIVEEIALSAARCSRLCHPVLFVHNVVLLLWVLFQSLRVAATMVAPDLNAVVVDSDTFYGFFPAVKLRNTAHGVAGVMTLLGWYKLVHYLEVFPSVRLVVGTLSRSLRGAVVFLAVFCVFTYAFAGAFMICFGTRLEQYRNLESSAFSLFKALTGAIDFDELREADWLLGPLMACAYITTSLFVFLNILIAIVLQNWHKENLLFPAEEEEEPVVARVAGMTDREVARVLLNVLMAPIQHCRHHLSLNSKWLVVQDALQEGKLRDPKPPN